MIKKNILLCCTLLSGCAFNTSHFQSQPPVDLGFMFSDEANSQQLHSNEPSTDLIDAILIYSKKHNIKVRGITAFKANLTPTNYLIFTDDTIYVSSFNFGRLVKKGTIKLLSRFELRKMNDRMFASQPCKKYYQRTPQELSSDFHYFTQDGFNWICTESDLTGFDGGIRQYVKTIMEPDLRWQFYTQGPLTL